MYAKINNVNYYVEDGAVFSSEYNEKLDSGTIKIGNVSEIINMKPYDDVFIYNDSDTELYHFLINNFTEAMLTVNGSVYNYVINLFSETKGLETVQLPNKSVTEPLVYSKKKSVYKLAQETVNLYSPKVKVTNTAGTLWEYENKYEIDYTLQYTFGDVICPDFTLTSPNLRDYLTKLFITKDCLPYVKNNVIYALNITERKGTFDTAKTSYIYTSRDSSNHADILRRTYNSALSQDFSCRLIENMSFRNSDVALMTLENMRLEFRYNIYKVNKPYLCYYKKGTVLHSDGTTTPKMFLCKQDMSKLVLLNSERALLSQDWSDFNDTPPNSVEEMANYKLCTVGYDIGDNKITGWGTKYTYPQGWWDTTKTYIENIASLLDSFNPYGIYSYGYITNNLAEGDLFYIGGDLFDNMITPFSALNNSLKQKAFFFEVDYNAFYNGTVLHSKDNGIDNIVMNDNSSSSLTLLEADGLFQKEKINRFGNKAYQITARYNDISEVQELGSVYGDDIIIYSTEITINANSVDAVYNATKDYVLKNYFTSVYAKHRPYNLMSYGESIRRSENKKNLILLSKENNYSEESDYSVDKFLSTFLPSDEATSIGNIPQNDKINYGYIKFKGNTYASDVNSFVTGNSLCFNLSMFDNVSAGVYIKTLEPTFNAASTDDDLTGSVQNWYLTVDDIETGYTQYLGFYVAHVNKNDEYNEVVQDYNKPLVLNNYTKLQAFPKVTIPSTKTNVIGGLYEVNKDNKEIIDMTFQFEPVSDTDDIVFSSWFMKLNNLQGRYNKVFEDYSTTDRTDVYLDSTMFSSVCNAYIEDPDTGVVFYDQTYYPIFVLKIAKVDINKLKAGLTISNVYPYTSSDTSSITNIDYYIMETKTLASVSSDLNTITLNVTETYIVNGTTYVEDGVLTLKNNSYEDKDGAYSNYIYGSETERETNYYYSSLSIRELDIAGAYTHTRNSTSSINNYVFTATNWHNYNPNLIAGSSNGIVSTTTFNDTSSQTEQYTKNMFIVASDNKLTKTLVYDELDSINDSGENVDAVFYMDVDSNIRVNTTSLPSTTRSVQIWFYDNGSYKFVFGVNLSEAEIANNVTTIYTNIVKNRDKKVYDKYKKFVIGSASLNNTFNVI